MFDSSRQQTPVGQLTEFEPLSQHMTMLLTALLPASWTKTSNNRTELFRYSCVRVTQRQLAHRQHHAHLLTTTKPSRTPQGSTHRVAVNRHKMSTHQCSQGPSLNTHRHEMSTHQFRQGSSLNTNCHKMSIRRHNQRFSPKLQHREMRANPHGQGPNLKARNQAAQANGHGPGAWTRRRPPDATQDRQPERLSTGQYDLPRTLKFMQHSITSHERRQCMNVNECSLPRCSGTSPT